MHAPVKATVHAVCCIVIATLTYLDIHGARDTKIIMGLINIRFSLNCYEFWGCRRLHGSYSRNAEWARLISHWQLSTLIRLETILNRQSKICQDNARCHKHANVTIVLKLHLRCVWY